MFTLQTQHDIRRAAAIATLVKHPNQPTVWTDEEWSYRLHFLDDAGYCLDAVQPAQGSHEAYATAVFTHCYRDGE